MRLAPNLLLRGTAALVPILLALSCARRAAPAVLPAVPPGPQLVEASVLTAVLVGGPLLGIAVVVFAFMRRRRGPEPLSRLLIAGSLRDMQRPRPYRHRAEP